MNNGIYKFYLDKNAVLVECQGIVDYSSLVDLISKIHIDNEYSYDMDMIWNLTAATKINITIHEVESLLRMMQIIRLSHGGKTIVVLPEGKEKCHENFIKLIEQAQFEYEKMATLADALDWMGHYYLYGRKKRSNGTNKDS